jgi:hypothetical protein
MPDYTKAIIYKLCCRDVSITNIYVGSSCNFTKRKCEHKLTCNNENYKSHNLYVYEFIRHNGGWKNWDMVFIEKFPTTDKHTLHTRERYWIENLQSTLNKNIPTQTYKEYSIKNPDKIKEKNNNYKLNNTDKLKEYNKEYYINNSDKFKEYKKEYYVKNYDKIKEYCLKNNDKLKEKITCECSLIVSKAWLSQHKRTKKHTNYLLKK